MYLSIGKVAKLMDVSVSTLRRWDNDTVLSASYKTCGGHRRYKLTKILIFCSQIGRTIRGSANQSDIRVRAITYARVSSARQKEDLKRQQNHLEAFVNDRQWSLLKAYRDIGSGLNDKPTSLLRMVKELPLYQPNFLVCSYDDRLARFGTTIIKTVCDLFGTTILFTKKTDHVASLDNRLVTDVIAVLTSFAGKIHRRRRGRQTAS